MEKRTYKKVMEVPTEMLVTEPVLVDQIKERVTSDVINGLVGLLSTGSEYIVSLSEIVEMPTYTADFMSRFEQKINVVPLVRCKDCKKAPKCYSEMLMVSKRGGDIYCSVEYCSLAERRTDEAD